MSWTDFYLVCLIVGLSLSVLSFVLGAFHLHLPRHGWHFFSGGHAHSGLLHGGHGAAHLDAADAASGPGESSHLSAANFSMLMVFLAWFGGTGTVLVDKLDVNRWFALAGAMASGVVGAYLVYLFVARLLMAQDHAMRPRDYMLPGTLGTLTLGIRAEGGTGEIAYVQGGTRKSAAARLDEAGSLPLGTEVIVTRFEEGIAYVRRFDPLRDRTI